MPSRGPKSPTKPQKPTSKKVAQPSSPNDDIFRLIFSNVGAAIAVAQGEYMKLANPKLCEYIGYSEEELLSRPFLSFIHPDDRALVADRYTKRLQGQEVPNEYTFRFIHRDGSVRWASISGGRTQWNGQPTNIVFFREVTEEHEHQTALKESEVKLKAIMELSPDIISILDEKGTLLYESPSAVRVQGYQLGELNGQSAFFHIHPDDRPRVAETFQRLLAEPLKTHKVHYRYQHKNGSYFWFESTAINQCANPLVKGVIAVSRDISERIKTEESLRNTAKLESLGVLAGGIAHDFNNLLSGIFGYLELAQRYAANKRAENYLDRAMAVYNRARDLTQQLLTFSKGGDPVKKTMPLGPLLQEGASFVLSGSNVIPIFDLPDDLWLCDIDEHQIGQVVDNLVLNARQAMPTGGTLFISVRNVPESVLLPTPLPKGKYVSITIRDEGNGIPAEHLTRIFDPFFTTKQEGSGLGLATAHSIVRRHAGHIEACSQLGQGSTFQVYLPASEKQAHPGMSPRNQEPPGRGRILFMDDEDFLRDVSSELLEGMGYEVECARDGAEAIDLFSQAKEEGRPFDAVILDLTVPGGMGGREAVVKILERDPQALVIASSGYSSDPVMADPPKFGFAGKLPKPYRQADAAGILRAVLSRKK